MADTYTEDRLVGLLIRLLLLAASGVTALLIARDAPNFAVVQGMIVLALVAAAVALLALFSRR